jgi:hypothetical protein
VCRRPWGVRWGRPARQTRRVIDFVTKSGRVTVQIGDRDRVAAINFGADLPDEAFQALYEILDELPEHTYVVWDKESRTWKKLDRQAT